MDTAGVKAVVVMMRMSCPFEATRGVEQMQSNVARGTVSVPEAAKRLGCHPRTLLKALREKRFPGIQINRRWRVSVAVMEQQLAQGGLAAN